jgi:hypothetical protein
MIVRLVAAVPPPHSPGKLRPATRLSARLSPFRRDGPATLLDSRLHADYDKRAKAHGMDRAAYLRKLVSEATAREEEDDVVRAYHEGKRTLSSAATELGVDVWGFFDLLRRRGDSLSVTLEDWMDSQESI